MCKISPFKKKTAKALALSEKHLAHAQQIADIGSWEYIIGDDQITCSENFYHIFGIEKSEHTPMSKPFGVVYPEDVDQTWDYVNKAVEKGESYTTSFRICHGVTKELRYLQVQADITWKGGKPQTLVGVVRDCTNERKIEREFNENIDNFRFIFDNLDAAIWVKNVQTNTYTHISEGARSLYQYPLDDWYEDPAFFEKVIHPTERDEVLAHQKALTKGETLYHQYRVNCGDGTTKWVYDQTIPLLDESGELVRLFGMQIDITPQIELQRKLQFFDTNDPLTSLPNQQSLYKKLDELCEQGVSEPFALLYLDLDYFNRINNSLGYPVGDEVLKRVTNRLISLMPENGYVSRLNGNNFVVIVPKDGSLHDMTHFAEDIVRAIRKPLEVKGYELHITASIGISHFPDNGKDKLSVMESAYAALFQAKQLGKNNCQVYSYSKDISSYKKYLLEKDMRQAIDDNDFELYYQPKVDCRSGLIKGAEALIRWNHEEWGLVLPGEFIPLAEENHQIHQISEWVMKNVCEQLQKWRDNGDTLYPISINISPISFLRKDLVGMVQKYLTLYDIPAELIELEITEGFLLKTEERVLTSLAELRKMGIAIAIDDFGTGFASLDYLRTFQADTLKIDRVFIQHMQENGHQNAAIVSAVLQLAKGLGMKVVAEGVDEYEQYQILKQKECDLIQGYLFSKPVPADTFEQMMRTGFLKPREQAVPRKSQTERRNYFRFKFPHFVKGQMKITEVNKKKTNLGYADILIENISLGGMKVVSPLRLPVNTTMKFSFNLVLLDETFNIDGRLVWKNEEKFDTYHYGVSFSMKEQEMDQLASVINKMTILKKLNHDIPHTDFVKGNPYAYLNQKPL